MPGDYFTTMNATLTHQLPEKAAGVGEDRGGCDPGVSGLCVGHCLEPLDFPFTSAGVWSERSSRSSPKATQFVAPGSRPRSLTPASEVSLLCPAAQEVKLGSQLKSLIFRSRGGRRHWTGPN